MARSALSRRPWYTAWPAIVAGFLLGTVPGVILLWLRRGVRLRTRLIVTAAAPVLLFAQVAPLTTDAPDVDASAQAAHATPSPSAAAPETSATPAPSPAGAASETAPAAPSPSPSPSASATAEPAAVTGTALAAVGELTVKGRAPKTGYDRDLFAHWVDPDGNGCDARNDILARDLTGITLGADGCTVVAGRLADPYTGTFIDFVRGQSTSGAVQIDHVVALSDAWQKGAQQWSSGTRTLFANDPLNLLAVDGPANAQKGDGDTATWLPSNKAFRCQYVARQVAVKLKYQVAVTQAESDAMTRVLATCPEEPLPDAGTPVDVEATEAPAPVQTSVAPAPAETAEASSTDVFYQNCDAVRAAGKAPIREGDPGYSRKLDRDGDGVGCE